METQRDTPTQTIEWNAQSTLRTHTDERRRSAQPPTHTPSRNSAPLHIALSGEEDVGGASEGGPHVVNGKGEGGGGRGRVHRDDHSHSTLSDVRGRAEQFFRVSPRYVSASARVTRARRPTAQPSSCNILSRMQANGNVSFAYEVKCASKRGGASLCPPASFFRRIL